jgi:hypothetical protein
MVFNLKNALTPALSLVARERTMTFARDEHL